MAYHWYTQQAPDCRDQYSATLFRSRADCDHPGCANALYGSILLHPRDRFFVIPLHWFLHQYKKRNWDISRGLDGDPALCQLHTSSAIPPQGVPL